MSPKTKLPILREKLKTVFGYNSFRGNQEAVITNILGGRNTFVIMPTGAGKSMCYQLPALAQEGLAIIISPLIALMKNQVDQLNAFDVNAKFLNSTLSKRDITKIKKECASGEVKLLYVAPESLNKEETIEFLQKIKISFVAIDEAHCISEWGHDFRPEYRRIKTIIAKLGKLPIIALTATATPKVRQDIQKNLQMEEADVFVSSFNRENLYYEVRPKKETKKQLIRFLKEHQGKSGIVYCLSRKKVEEIAELINVNGFKAVPYHAGLDSDVRIKNQDDFLNEEVHIVVATIAFGMGIDKPDVRFVIHYDVPKSLEGYYQETGRAGRDGLEGHCLMFFSEKDINKLEKFNKDKTVQERENAYVLLQEMEFYAESPICRRRQLLHYFGEEFMLANCKMCDNCVHPKERFEGAPYITLALQAAQQSGERFGLKHLANILRGEADEYVTSYSHSSLPVFGKGADKEKDFWQSIIRQSLIYSFLEKDIENIGALHVSKKGKEFLKKPHPVELALDHNYISLNNEEDSIDRAPSTMRSYDKTLFDLLKSLCRTIGKEKNLAPYLIFTEPSLEEMATTYPTTKDALASIVGVGMGKVNKFGAPFIELISQYVEEHSIETDLDIVVKSSVNKSKIKIFIIQQIDRKADLEEIASAKSITFDELLTEMENICYSGTKLNINYHIEAVIDKQKEEEIIEYFLQAPTDELREAMNELPDCTEEELRLVRIKVLTEYAN